MNVAISCITHAKNSRNGGFKQRVLHENDDIM